MSSRIKPFDVSIETSRLTTEWEVWKHDLESFFAAHHIDLQRDKRAHLAYLGGPGLQELLRHLPGVDNVPHVTVDPPFYDVAVKCLDGYFEPFRRKTYERHVFHQIAQAKEERFADFVIRLRKQIARCSYAPTVVDELIADRIAQGCASEELRIKLLQRDRTLDEIVALGTSLAESSEQSKKLHCSPNAESQDIHTVIQRDRNRPTNNRYNFGIPSRGDRGYTSNDRFICYGCGRRGHTQRSNDCPAKQTKCSNCGKEGHWAKRCFLVITHRNVATILQLLSLGPNE